MKIHALASVAHYQYHGGMSAKRHEAWAAFERLAALETDDCVEWPFATDGRGYGRIRQPGTGTNIRTSRLVLLRRGPAPFPGAEAGHGPCHNRICMNYRHLSWRSRAENTGSDRERDGTSNKGERHGMAKLTEDDVRRIRQLVAQGVAQGEVATMMAIGRGTVNRIARRRHPGGWAWVA